MGATRWQRSGLCVAFLARAIVTGRAAHLRAPLANLVDNYGQREQSAEDADCAALHLAQVQRRMSKEQLQSPPCCEPLLRNLSLIIFTQKRWKNDAMRNADCGIQVSKKFRNRKARCAMAQVMFDGKLQMKKASRTAAERRLR